MDQKQPGLRYAWPWETAIGDERKVLEESRKLASEYVCSTGIAEVLRCGRAVQTLDVYWLDGFPGCRASPRTVREGTNRGRSWEQPAGQALEAHATCRGFGANEIRLALYFLSLQSTG